MQLHTPRSAPLAARREPAGAADDLTELLAELLERAWRRRHPVETALQPGAVAAVKRTATSVARDRAAQ